MPVLVVALCSVAAIYAAVVAQDTGHHSLWVLVVLNVLFALGHLPSALKYLK